MAGRKSDFTLPTNTLDELFSSQEERDEAKLSKIRDIPLDEIDDFPDHPFKVREDEDMFQLVESIKERGVITPATVRQKEDGRYELISGHRRKRACELAGFETLRCEVVDLDRDEATILMVESNFQRSQILPSEKAHAYKMRLDAMKRQAGRPRKENLVPVGQNYSREELASQSGESQTQIQRYVRLTNLVPELLEFVDEGRIKMRPAVELSYLNEDCQRDLVDEIDLNDCTPSHDQAIRMRERDENFNKVSTGGKDAVLDQISPNHPLYDKIMSYYNSMAASVQKHSKLPSFLTKTPGSAQEIELEWDGSKYTVTLTDSNNVLSGYKFSSNDSGVQFSVRGNKLTITAEKAPSDGLTITAEKTAQRKGVITWTDGIYGPNGGVQDTVTYAQTVNDPVKGFLKLKVSYGSAKIVKTSEDGKVDGISFRIQGNGIDKTVKTENGGQIQVDNLMPGVYTVKNLCFFFFTGNH